MKTPPVLQLFMSCAAYAFGLYMGAYLVETIFMTGYTCAVLNLEQRGRRDVKSRIVKVGNILKYPFRNESRETAPPSDSDCAAQSPCEAQKEKGIDDAG